jgi:L-arabinokinase
LFRQLLLDAPSEERRRLLGELMYESHASYSACGLGSKGTDQIVSNARAEGPANGVYGARITGGGSGGTVAILGSAESGDTIRRIAERYESVAGYRPHIFRGSSPGAAQFGSRSLRV